MKQTRLDPDDPRHEQKNPLEGTNPAPRISQAPDKSTITNDSVNSDDDSENTTTQIDNNMVENKTY
jgi:hypothetical protein